MTILVTGGTGFIGSAIVKELVQQGESVRVLARTSSRIDHLQTLGVDIVYGDILNPESLTTALSGCDTLFHCAAIYDLWVRDKQAMFRAAVDGTRNVLTTALLLGVSKVIYTSSCVTIGELKNTIGDEQTVHRNYYLCAYERAKKAAEDIALEFIGRGAPIIIVHPAAVYGPGDFKPTGRSIIDAINGSLPATFKGWISLVYIDDVAKGHVLVMQKGQIGEYYILAESAISLDQYFSTICRLGGSRKPPVVPGFVSACYAGLGELLALFTHKPPILPYDNFKLLHHGNRVDGSKANQQLGLQYTPLEHGLIKTIDWYWRHGYLKQKPACSE